MPQALCCMSHSPLIDITTQSAELEADVESALADARRFVEDYDPEVVVLFTPDHYNGFFYRVMPPFCIGTAGRTIGDYGTASGELDVPAELATSCAVAVLESGVDVAISYRMELDHGTAQPLVALFGGLAERPVVPVFINAAAQPLAPLPRSRALGSAIGRFFADRPERVLFVGSGGLSHDPPMPVLQTAPPDVAERLISGRTLTPEEQERKHTGAIEEAKLLASGRSKRQELAPEWDQALLDILTTGDLARLDHWSNEEIESHGCGSHEIRTWAAAYAALAAGGPFVPLQRYYRPIPEYIAGFAVTTARRGMSEATVEGRPEAVDA